MAKALGKSQASGIRHRAPGKKIRRQASGAGRQAKNQRYIGFKVQGTGYKEGDRNAATLLAP